jgi:oxygen-independent coproporphyrinogen-3 oxidase
VSLSLYFHIPFCKQRCDYCDFTTYAGFERLIPAYMDALCKQTALLGGGETVYTIYLGGGTPSLVPPAMYAQLLKTIRDHFSILTSAEITLEANPGTVDLESLSGFYKVGFNRISFGMQSAKEEELSLLGRIHKPVDIEKAVEYARVSGFDNINFDLIYGLPGQSLEDWRFTLNKALELKPKHLSLYSLIVEEGTPFARRIRRGEIPKPDDDIAAEQYEWSCEVLQERGYRHYELSNWALVGDNFDYRCNHNLQYWRLQSYMGLGCGAVGFLPAGEKAGLTMPHLMENPQFITHYIRQVEEASQSGNPQAFLRTSTMEFEMETFVYMGLRLLEEGISPKVFLDRFGQDQFSVFGEKLKRLIDQELLEYSLEGNLRLTRNAWLVANRVFREFIDEADT